MAGRLSNGVGSAEEEEEDPLEDEKDEELLSEVEDPLPEVIEALWLEDPVLLDVPAWLEEEGFSVELPSGEDEDLALGLHPPRQSTKQLKSPIRVGFLMFFSLRFPLKARIN